MKLESKNRSTKEIDELETKIVELASLCGTVKYHGVDGLGAKNPYIYINISTNYNLTAIALNISEKTGLHYRIDKRTRSMKFLL